MAAPNKFLSVLAANQSSIRNFDALRMDKLEQVRQTGTVFSSAAGTVCQAASSRWLELANANGAIAAIIADERLEQSASTIGVNKPIILTASPEKLFLEAHLAGIHDSRDANIPFSKIHPTAVLLGDVVLGDDVDIGPNVSIVGPVRIGAKTRIEPNCVVGAEGLFAKKLGDELIHVPHFGGVSIGERCVVHAGAVIVRSAFADEWTQIADDVHVGVMTNVGHDAQIGTRTVVSSNVVIAGRVRIGHDCWIGASSSISNGLSIGDRAQVKIGAVVIADVEDDAAVSGNFATAHRLNLLSHARLATRR